MVPAIDFNVFETFCFECGLEIVDEEYAFLERREDTAVPRLYCIRLILYG